MANNGIIGDEDLGLNMPKTEVEEQGLSEERNIAKFTRTKEFKRLQDHCNQRIEFYQTRLPGSALNDPLASLETIGEQWKVADAVIGEFRALLNAYEMTAQAVKEADAAKSES